MYTTLRRVLDLLFKSKQLKHSHILLFIEGKMIVDDYEIDTVSEFGCAYLQTNVFKTEGITIELKNGKYKNDIDNIEITDIQIGGSECELYFKWKGEEING